MTWQLFFEGSVVSRFPVQFWSVIVKLDWISSLEVTCFKMHCPQILREFGKLNAVVVIVVMSGGHEQAHFMDSGTTFGTRRGKQMWDIRPSIKLHVLNKRAEFSVNNKTLDAIWNYSVCGINAQFIIETPRKKCTAVSFSLGIFSSANPQFRNWEVNSGRNIVIPKHYWPT